LLAAGHEAVLAAVKSHSYCAAREKPEEALRSPLVGVVGSGTAR